MPLNTQEIQQLIPHRPPFLWLDEVTDVTSTTIRALKRIEPELDVFRGHYPHFPILPGVLQCEAIFQAGALLIARSISGHEGHVPAVTRLNNVQFRKMVVPGDLLEIEAEITEQVSNAYYLRGKTSVEGKVACRLEFACTLAPLPGGKTEG